MSAEESSVEQHPKTATRRPMRSRGDPDPAMMPLFTSLVGKDRLDVVLAMSSLLAQVIVGSPIACLTGE